MYNLFHCNLINYKKVLDPEKAPKPHLNGGEFAFFVVSQHQFVVYDTVQLEWNENKFRLFSCTLDFFFGSIESSSLHSMNHKITSRVSYDCMHTVSISMCTFLSFLQKPSTSCFFVWFSCPFSALRLHKLNTRSSDINCSCAECNFKIFDDSHFCTLSRADQSSGHIWFIFHLNTQQKLNVKWAKVWFHSRAEKKQRDNCTVDGSDNFLHSNAHKHADQQWVPVLDVIRHRQTVVEDEEFAIIKNSSNQFLSRHSQSDWFTWQFDRVMCCERLWKKNDISSAASNLQFKSGKMSIRIQQCRDESYTYTRWKLIEKLIRRQSTLF